MERRLMSRLHYGGKSQYDKIDELVTRFGHDDDAFIAAVMNDQLLNHYAATHERITRDAILKFMPYKFLGNGTPFKVGTADLSLLTGDTYTFDLKFLEEVALRMAFRSESALKQWGDYAQPVPGQNFRDTVLVTVPTSVYWDLQNDVDSQYAIDLRQLGDQRIINGGKIMWRNMVVQDGGIAPSLFNAGKLITQKKVTSPIKWGDGAPDPNSGPTVDNIWITGQAGENCTHYVQLEDFAEGDYVEGDYVAIHTRRTNAWGITGGVDFLDGETMTAEVYQVDAANNRLVFRKPLTYAYDKTIEPGCYAYVTRAQHIYPVYVQGARGMVTWAAREKVEWSHPKDVEADIQSIERVVWHERGEMNLWNPDICEIAFCTGSFALRGGVSIR
jgi:hypothetical protein